MRWIFVLATATACSSGGSSTIDANGQGSADAASLVDAAPRPVPQLTGTDQLCKLLSNLNTSDPTANDVQHRANILGADLGIPVVLANNLYIMFGDTIGYRVIWGDESHPDSVGVGTSSATQIAANPSLLCNGLKMLTLPPNQSIGPGADSSIEADFAGVYMTPPSGQSIGDYINNPSGPRNQNAFPNLPGDFEVPSGAFAAGNSIYILYTTVVSPNDITMKGSYLAKWAAPSPTGLPNYQILYGVDQRFDNNGPLRGNYINIATETKGNYVYLFGTGQYRASPVHLARKSLSTIETAGGIEVFDAAGSQWLPAGSQQAPLFGPDGFGETSVRYFASIDRWMFLGEELTATSNRIVARFAEAPEGPWSDAIIVHDMADPTFRAAYCCVPNNNCTGEQFFNCDRTGFYGTYMLPEVVENSDGSFTVAYTMSSFDPYNVALYTATFR